MYEHASVGNKSLGKTVTTFALTVSLEATTVASIDIERAFYGDGEKICLPTTEVLLRKAAGKIAKLKKLWDWTSRNAVLLPPFLTEIVLTDGGTASEVLLQIFFERTNKQEEEKAT